MDTSIGVTFKDFVILAADKGENMGILRYAESGSKIYELTSQVAMAIQGEPGDVVQFSKFVKCNFELEKFRDDGCEVSLKRAFHWVTWELAQSIRSNHPYGVFPLVGGYDQQEKQGKLYWIDYLGTGCEITYGGHGYGQALAIGYLDRHHKPDMNLTDAIELVKDALIAGQTRIVVGQNVFQMVVVDKEGVKQLPDYHIDRSRCIPK